MPEFIYRPMIHPHLVAVGGLGEVVENDDLDLWTVDWTKLKELGPAVYGAAMLGPIHGALIGMDEETVNSILKVYLEIYGVLETYKQLMGIWPVDTTKLEAERDHLMEKSFKMYQFSIDLMAEYKAGRDALITSLAAGAVELDAKDFAKVATSAGWTQAEIAEALATAQKSNLVVKPGKKAAPTGIVIFILALIVWQMSRR